MKNIHFFFGFFRFFIKNQGWTVFQNIDFSRSVACGALMDRTLTSSVHLLIGNNQIFEIFLGGAGGGTHPRGATQTTLFWLVFMISIDAQ